MRDDSRTRYALEAYVSLGRGHSLGPSVNAFRIQRVRHMTGDWHVPDRRRGVERSGFWAQRGLRRQCRAWNSARHRRNAGGGAAKHIAVTALLAPLTRSSRDGCGPTGARPAEALSLEKSVSCERSTSRYPKSHWLCRNLLVSGQLVIEPCGATVQPARRIRDLHAIGDPEHRAVKIWKTPGIHTGHGTVERTLQLASAVEQVERPLELALARGLERVLMEKDVLLGREVDRRRDLVRLFGPVGHVDVAGGGCAPRTEIMAEVQIRAIDVNRDPSGRVNGCTSGS